MVTCHTMLRNRMPIRSSPLHSCVQTLADERHEVIIRIHLLPTRAPTTGAALDRCSWMSVLLTTCMHALPTLLPHYNLKLVQNKNGPCSELFKISYALCSKVPKHLESLLGPSRTGASPACPPQWRTCRAWVRQLAAWPGTLSDPGCSVQGLQKAIL
jgi:hypothetical protein